MDRSGPRVLARLRARPLPPLLPRVLAGAPFGWLLALVGGALCVLGWYAVSGERVTARQLPYLASATAPGSALIVAGVVWAALHTAPPGAGRAGGPSAASSGPASGPPSTAAPEPGAGPGPSPSPSPSPEWLPPAPAGGADAGAVPGDGLLAVPGGTLCHRPGCPLVAGKPQAVALTGAAVRERGLAPCPVCEPEVLPADGPA
ncbi:hypothetical protein [Kitasatospora sp. LaBMicrA B282]|uniref:hypothetical protein n=1 Tax=Kitasatospora sp. LaBMicrA B282 TaxID=3420949 RepID=UPI003D0C0833